MLKKNDKAIVLELVNSQILPIISTGIIEEVHEENYIIHGEAFPTTDVFKYPDDLEKVREILDNHWDNAMERLQEESTFNDNLLDHLENNGFSNVRTCILSYS